MSKHKNQALPTEDSCYCWITKLCQLLATLWTAAWQASLSFTISGSLFKFMSTESVMSPNHLILCCSPLLLMHSIIPSIRVFSSESVLCIRWPKAWSDSLPSWSHLILISFCCVLGLCHSFRSCVLCLSLLLHLHVVIFPLLLLIFYLCFNFCQFDHCVSWCVPLLVYPSWETLLPGFGWLFPFPC